MLSAAPVSAQSDATARTAWGDPDISGLWDFRTLTPLERPPSLTGKATLTPEEAQAFRQSMQASLNVDNRQDENASLDLRGAYNQFWYDWGDHLDEDLRTALIIEPASGHLPGLTASARQRLQAQTAARTGTVRDLFSPFEQITSFHPENPEQLGLADRCLVGLNAGPPLSASAYNNNLRVVQTPGHVLLVTEMIHNARVVPLDGRPYLPGHMSQWNGDPRGRWRDDTLIVESRNFSDKIPAFQLSLGLFHTTDRGGAGSGRDLTLVETFRRTAPGRLEYRYTVTAPRTFTAPFTVAMTMRQTDGPMFEYACHEGNYAMGGILRGARKLEQAAAAPPRR